MSWTEYFIRMAELVAMKSKDPSTKTGVVIVNKNKTIISTGYNGFPAGVADHSYRYADRETKYKMICHAETNAIYQAAKSGISTDGATMFTSFGPVTCCECAKSIIQAGIVDLVGREIDGDFGGGRWNDSIRLGSVMLLEAGVNQRSFNGKG